MYKEDLTLEGKGNVLSVDDPGTLEERLKAMPEYINYRVEIVDNKRKWLVLERSYSEYSWGERAILDFVKEGLTFWFGKLDAENKKRLKQALIAYLNRLSF
ncbi:MAG: hypothetical protein AB1349_12265 [Elusimicrobiota bacterium]